LGGYRAPYLKSAATVRDASRNSPSRLESPWRAYGRPPGEMDGIGAIDADLARDLAAAAARDSRSTWCVTVTGPDSRPVAHGCGRPPPRTSPRTSPGDDRSPPGTGALRLNPAALTGTGSGKDLIFALESLAGPCDHAHQAAGHDPGVKLRHLTAILNSSCTFSCCRRPAASCDYEHSTPYEQGGRTCLCDAGPVCRHDHRTKQSPGWRLEQAGQRGWFRWTTPSGRTYLSRPTQYPDLRIRLKGTSTNGRHGEAPARARTAATATHQLRGGVTARSPATGRRAPAPAGDGGRYLPT
jgi:hypothetical protein